MHSDQDPERSIGYAVPIRTPRPRTFVKPSDEAAPRQSQYQMCLEELQQEVARAYATFEDLAVILAPVRKDEPLSEPQDSPEPAPPVPTTSLARDVMGVAHKVRDLRMAMNMVLKSIDL